MYGIINCYELGVETTVGKHEIVLYYVTPGIKVGAVISGISLFIVLVYIIKHAVGRKRDLV